MSKIEKYIFRTNGGNTCDKCAENNGKEFYNPQAVPDLPIHPNCSCWVEPIEAEEDNSNDQALSDLDELIGDARSKEIQKT